MLSRVAERIYWMCRYLERAENTARLVTVYGELLMDLPAEANLDWNVPLFVLGLEQAWRNAAQGPGELDFLLRGVENPASLQSSVQQARENARTTRDVLPSEAWLAINELHLSVERALANPGRNRGAQVSREIVCRCREITGIIESSVSRGPVYQFIRLGRNLERADMTSRMIDVAAAIMLTERKELKDYTSTVWRGVLRALNAYQMYRQHVRRRITGHDVVAFLLLDPGFPRSVAHCVGQLHEAASSLPRGTAACRRIDSIRDKLAGIEVAEFDYALVHGLVDDLQIDLASLNDTVFQTWLNPVRAS